MIAINKVWWLRYKIVKNIMNYKEQFLAYLVKISMGIYHTAKMNLTDSKKQIIVEFKAKQVMKVAKQKELHAKLKKERSKNGWKLKRIRILRLLHSQWMCNNTRPIECLAATIPVNTSLTIDTGVRR
jgi:hypothetical protein